MYEGMLGALGELKDDSMRVAKIGVSVFAGAAAAKIVVGLSDRYFSSTGTGDAAQVDKESMLYKYVNPLLPALVGVVIVNRLGNQYPEYSLGAAAGMFSYTLGALLSRNFGAEADATGKRLSPFDSAKAYGALGAPDNYDSSLLAGLGQARYGGVNVPNYSISRYLSGAPTQIQSLMGAPTQIQSLMGAPTQIQSLQGAPTQIQSLSGAPTQVQTASPAAMSAAATLV
jgi:hypothetical protein